MGRIAIVTDITAGIPEPLPEKNWIRKIPYYIHLVAEANQTQLSGSR